MPIKLIEKECKIELPTNIHIQPRKDDEKGYRKDGRIKFAYKGETTTTTEFVITVVTPWYDNEEDIPYNIDHNLKITLLQSMHNHLQNLILSETVDEKITLEIT